MSGLHRKLQQKATKVKVKLENPTITLRHSSVIIQMMLKVDNHVLSFQTELVENVKRTLNWLLVSEDAGMFTVYFWREDQIFKYPITYLLTTLI